jgi:hypothetical protein
MPDHEYTLYAYAWPRYHFFLIPLAGFESASAYIMHNTFSHGRFPTMDIVQQIVFRADMPGGEMSAVSVCRKKCNAERIAWSVDGVCHNREYPIMNGPECEHRRIEQSEAERVFGRIDTLRIDPGYR